jgi:hypothetical protein
MCEELVNGNKPAQPGFLDTGVDPCTAENVDVILRRETDPEFERQWYKKYYEENYTPVWEKLKPWSELDMRGKLNY